MVSPNPYAPYAPPAPIVVPVGYRSNVIVPAGQRRGHLPSTALRTWKLILGLAFVVATLVLLGLSVAGAVLVSQHDPDGAGVMLICAGGAMAFIYVVLFALTIVGLLWVYRFWSWLPPDQRHTNLWKRYISPAAAVGFMLIPYFNLYWMFVIYLGTCDALDRMRVLYPTSKPAPKNLAIAMIVVSFVFFPVAPFLQYLYDKELEGLAAEMDGSLPPRLV